MSAAVWIVLALLALLAAGAAWLIARKIRAGKSSRSSSAGKASKRRDVIVAVDFQTANQGYDSACAIGITRIDGGKVRKTTSFLIRPPDDQFSLSDQHGITWDRVRTQPDFAQIWPKIEKQLAGADYLAAHDAKFDKAVMEACLIAHQIDAHLPPWICTIDLARRVWNIYPTKLPDVCRHLDIEFNHHEAGSDAAACAQIVKAALDQGLSISIVVPVQ